MPPVAGRVVGVGCRMIVVVTEPTCTSTLALVGVDGGGVSLVPEPPPPLAGAVPIAAEILAVPSRPFDWNVAVAVPLPLVVTMDGIVPRVALR